MSKEVLLMDDVKDLGEQGDIVNVADGYARNYLFPKGLAAPVTEATRRRIVKLKDAREARRKEEEAEARRKAAKLKDVSVTLTAKVSEGETLYGSISSVEIVDALKAQGIEIERAKVQLEHPIKELGIFEVPIRLHADVIATLKVWVVEE